MSRALAAIVGGAAGAVALVGVVILVTWFFLCNNRSVSRTSETGSSDPSQVGRPQGVELVVRETRRFEIEELSLATKGFSEKNLIGEVKSSFKRRGYCQANGQQILVYEYVPNGSVSIHLYGAGQVTKEKLEFKHRLSIALGAAKGLAHLHSLSPRLAHKDFKTANVLVDENFIAKVADAGVRNFLGRGDTAGPSSQVTADEIFLAPELYPFRTLSSIIDPRLGNSFTAEGMEEYIQLIVRCVEVSSERRPTMSYIVTELDRILEKEMSLTTIMGEGTPVVTLGSQLFRAAK
nr:nodulation receptor kinase [Tanacetum cinerariifolium]